MGRSARGVRAMNLAGDDHIISCDVAGDGEDVMLLSERGVGKRTRFDEFTPHHRATGGMLAMKISERTGRLVACHAVHEQDEMIAVTVRGRMIRVAVQEIRLLGRAATGDITVRLDEGDLVADCSVVRADALRSGEPEDGETRSLPFEGSDPT